MKKFFQKKTGRLSAAEARTIPIDDKYLNPIMDKIYDSIRFAASHGENKFWYYYFGHPNNTRDIIRQRLESDGYKVYDKNDEEFIHIGEWFISWEENK
jgi:hypothetical protein